MPVRNIIIVSFGLSIAVLGSVAAWRHTGNAVNQPSPRQPAVPVDIDMTALAPAIVKFCGDCHASPHPDRFPKAGWRDEVEKGFNFYYESSRADLTPPPLQALVEFFRRQAPDDLALPPLRSPCSPEPFILQPVTHELANRSAAPAVSHLVRWPTTAGQPMRLVMTDMRAGTIHTRQCASIAHPAHAEPCDLDRDGLVDRLVADLGSFEPADHDRGRVVWLRARTAEPEFVPIVLQTGLGRVADVQPADFDDDGDVDLVVAEFGWRKTGRILWLENQSGTNTPPQFVLHVLDSRHGAIHVPVIDLNADGRPDFVALISQEHEVVVAFLNQGGGAFHRETVFDSQDPAYGSSGIQLADLDRDGDCDVLYTNGDSFDTMYLKPYHAVHWLENRGGYPFTPHILAQLPGASRALAADVDSDGDLDVVAVAAAPEHLASPSQSHNATIDAVVWLEQTAPGRFSPRSLERSAGRHAALEIADFDGDGALDLAIGAFHFDQSATSPALTIWWNRPHAAPAAAQPAVAKPVAHDARPDGERQ